MKNVAFKSMVLSISLFFCLPLCAQFGGLGKKIADKTKDKFVKQAEDKLVEELSNELARRAFQPVSRQMEDIIRSSYEDSLGREVDWEKEDPGLFEKYMESLNNTAHFQDMYAFDVIMDIEIKDYEKEKHDVSYLFSKTSDVFGIVHREEEKESQMIIDQENDVLLVLTTDEKGNRQGQAIPSMFKYSSAYMAKHQNYEIEETSFTKTGKSKKIADYECDQFRGENPRDKIEFYVSREFPVSFEKAIGKTSSQFIPQNYSQVLALSKGMILQMDYKSKEDKKQKSSFKTKKITEERIEFKPGDYGLKRQPEE